MRAQPVRAGLLAEDDQPGEHRQGAGAGDEQRLQGGGAGRGSRCASLPMSRNDVTDVSSQKP